jgi:hypothetical protein
MSRKPSNMNMRMTILILAVSAVSGVLAAAPGTVRFCTDIALRAVVQTNQAPQSKPATLEEVVRQIVERAKADDVAFFSKYVDKGLEKQLIEQIKISGMADNYKTRLRDESETKARLDYHLDKKPFCHFQVDLEKRDGSWFLKRIWPCR